MSISVSKSCAILFAMLALTIPLANIAKDITGGVGFSGVIVPLVLVILLMKKRSGFKLSNDVLLYSIFLVCTLPSWITSENFQIIFNSLFGYLLVFLVSDKVFLSNRIIIVFLTCFLISTSVVALIVVLEVMSIVKLDEIYDYSTVYYLGFVPIALGFDTNPGGFATHFIFAIPTAYYLMLQSTNSTRYQYILILVLLIVVLVLTFSRSAVIGTLIACLIIRSSKLSPSRIFIRVITQLSLLSVMVICSFILLSFRENFSEILIIYENKMESVNIRVRALSTYLLLMFENPFFGIGYDKTKYFVQDAIGLSINSHNIFLGIFIEFGVITFLIFTLLICKSILNLRGFIKRIDSNVRDRQLFGLVLGCLCGFLFHGLFHQNYINLMFWLLIGLSTQLIKINRKDKSTVY